MKTKNIVHSNIRPEYIRIFYETNSNSINGFYALESSSEVRENLLTDQISKYNFHPPEYYRKDYVPSVYTDIWSIGMIVLRMCINDLSFLMDNEETFRFDLNAACSCLRDLGHSEEIINFIRCCLDNNPENRSSVDQLASHPLMLSISRLINFRFYLSEFFFVYDEFLIRYTRK